MRPSAACPSLVATSRGSVSGREEGVRPCPSGLRVRSGLLQTSPSTDVAMFGAHRACSDCRSDLRPRGITGAFQFGHGSLGDMWKEFARWARDVPVACAATRGQSPTQTQIATLLCIVQGGLLNGRPPLPVGCIARLLQGCRCCSTILPARGFSCPCFCW